MIRPFDLAMAGLLGVALIAAPLPFGSVTAEGTLAVVVFSLLALAATLILGRYSNAARRLREPCALLAALAVLGLLQILPWPPALRWLSPGHFVRGGWNSLTLSASDTRAAVLLILATVAVAFVSASVSRERKPRRLLAFSLLGSALLQLAVGFPAWIERRDTIWGTVVPNATDRLRGTFINPNHLALFLEMALAVTFAWGWWSFRRARREYSTDRRVLWAAGPVIVGLFLATGLVFTGSRAGLLALLCTLAFQSVLLGVTSRNWKATASTAFPIAAVALALMLALGGQAFARLTGTTAYDVQGTPRSVAYEATFDLWQRFPVLGTGLGSFQEAFPLVQSEAIRGTWRHAHSMPLEVLATAGIVGLAILAAAFFLLVRGLIEVLRRGVRSEDRAAALAALGALTAVLVHDSFDFGITMPANALALAVIVGAGVAGRWKPKSAVEPG